jgi:hypothetical protein
MTPWTQPTGDGAASVAGVITVSAGGMAAMLWTQLPAAGYRAIEAALALTGGIALAAATAGVLTLRRRMTNAE